MEDLRKRELPQVVVPGYNTPQIRIKRSGQFGSNQHSLDTHPHYATLPRNRNNPNRRSKSLVPNTSQHNTLSMFADSVRVLPRQPPQRKSSTASLGGPRSPSGSSPRIIRNNRNDDPDIKLAASISTVSCKRFNRISLEEQRKKQEERKKRKQEYFQSTPAKEIKINQRDLEAYVAFYEKRLADIMSDVDGDINKEKRRKGRLENKLKKLLEDNESLSSQLAEIRTDVRKCQTLTETPV